jgi:hypothetical protein
LNEALHFHLTEFKHLSEQGIRKLSIDNIWLICC